MFVINFNAGYGALQAGLEQIEAAAKADAINMEKLRERPVSAAD